MKRENQRLKQIHNNNGNEKIALSFFLVKKCLLCEQFQPKMELKNENESRETLTQ